MSKYRLYAAYGSNMNLVQMANRCPNSVVVGTGKIENYELEFRYYANIVPAKGKEVPVVVWAITEEDEKRLDRYEGVARGLYRKEEIKVKLENINDNTIVVGDKSDNIEIKALVYIMNTAVRSVQAPSAKYYDTILEGYRANGIDPYPLAVAAIQTGIEI
ncbi:MULTISPECIES: gamma-glutamylcyclotransferase family protein [Geobacillus]|uniref:Gamma-glutamylcyclotransferase n=1 Tax=Geobacillus thermocatenulatus TaxID=33938 RepID=A0A226Q9S3_9BACL|nr:MULTISPECIES: gamma-glutamylcyclotransferase family protein [Geobacillus]ASS98399.1 hypothetical protein GT3921_04645 [Geobacillus thermocatenulatus]ATA61226.1 gamma-glutamylcyclotransferase [Geobacillus stearothermophilus]MED3735061.1 gamma-glutamylcyclotransferase [Geobacillus stearothermophilus]MED3740291.1 gamma-glutamylcyclotransferase [Geobacillus stearothermophilus]MED3767695.1 gamma-glutamylcyclotransferase [Geobacillus stearothermophilus]